MPTSRILLRREPLGYVGFDGLDKSPYLLDYDALPQADRAAFHVVQDSVIAAPGFTLPLYMTVFPNLMCNKTCSYCTFRELLDGAPSTVAAMSDEVAASLVAECHRAGILVVNILGGEPLLTRTFPVVRDIIAGVLDYGAHVGLTTNGLTLSEFVKPLADLSARFEEDLDISVSVNADPNVFAPTSKLGLGLESVRDCRLPVSINTIIWDSDVCKYLRLIEHVKHISGEQVVRWNLLYPRAADSERIPISNYLKACDCISSRSCVSQVVVEKPFGFRYSEDSREITAVDRMFLGCGIGRRTIAVGPDGALYPCATLLYEEGFALGDIRGGLEEAWHQAIAIRTKFRTKRTPISCSSSCSAYEICDGCLAHDRRGTQPTCEFEQVQRSNSGEGR